MRRCHDAWTISDTSATGPCWALSTDTSKCSFCTEYIQKRNWVSTKFFDNSSSFESQMGNLSLHKTSFPQACMVSINVGLQEVLQKAAWLLCSQGSKSSLCSFPWNSCFSADTGQQSKQRIMPKKGTIPTSFRSLSIYIYIYIYMYTYCLSV